jgi:hypothetical protein
MPISMEISQGISLCSYLYLKQQKCLVFLCIFYLFSSTKSENRRAEQVLPRGKWVTPAGGGVGKESRKVNIVQNMCTCKKKTISVVKQFQE